MAIMGFWEWNAKMDAPPEPAEQPTKGYNPKEYFTAMAESMSDLHPLPMPLEVRMEPFTTEESAEGEFYIETEEAQALYAGNTVEVNPTMVIQMDPFDDLTRDELLEMIHTHLFIHEMAHALQYRSDEYEEAREDHHDAEWGVKYAQTYNCVLSRFEDYSEDEQNDILGLTDEKRESIISQLAATLTVFEQDSDDDQE